MPTLVSKSPRRLRRAGMSLAAIAALLWLGARDPGESCRVRLILSDAATGEEIPGWVRIADASGKSIAADGLLSRGQGLEQGLPVHQWQVVPRSAAFRLPRATYTFTAISGLETEEAQVEVDLTNSAEKTVTLPLTRFSSLSDDGFRSGNTHLHLRKVSRDDAMRYLRETPAADRLDALFVSYLERAGADQDYITNRMTAEDLVELTRQSRVVFGNGEEHRHNFRGSFDGFGHVMFLNISQLVLPVSIGAELMLTGNDDVPLARGIDTAHRDGSTVLWCHNQRGYEAVPNWLTGRIDVQNVFDGGVRSSYKDSSYEYLNAGLRVPFSTGTDWFLYDFSRVYVRMSEELTVENWLKGLAAGRSFITNGPLLDLRVARRTPGETVSLEGRGPVEVAARARGRIDFESIELIRNGEVVAQAQSRPVGGHFEAEIVSSLPVTGPCWFALRTPPPSVRRPPPSWELDPNLQQIRPRNELGCELFAHTSPVYVQVGGRSVFDRPTAERLLERIQWGRREVLLKGKFPDDAAKARVLDVYDEALAALERRMREG